MGALIDLVEILPFYKFRFPDIQIYLPENPLLNGFTYLITVVNCMLKCM
jgi:hypothetical protein